MASLSWHPEKGEAMSVRFAFLFAVYLAYALSSGIVAKQGSGADPLGHNPPSSPPVTIEIGGGLDPLG
ncbi:MAG: hypothetical protein WAM82_07780 [Thermoanaerobaculia bacterium]